MVSDDFVQLVKRMRELQAKYFKDRDPTTLRECKDLERRVDAAVKEITRGPKQPGLFDQAAP
jgi:hypothetical protein